MEPYLSNHLHDHDSHTLTINTGLRFLIEHPGTGALFLFLPCHLLGKHSYIILELLSYKEAGHFISTSPL